MKTFNTKLRNILFTLLYSVIIIMVASCGSDGSRTHDTYGGLYTVTFDSNGGSPVNPYPVRVESGSSVGAVNMPVVTQAGYTFKEWNTAQDGTGAVFTDSTPVTADITVYARWTAITYTVTFDAGGGTPSITTIAVDHGSSVGASRMPTVTNGTLIFKEWNTTLDGTGSAFTASTPVMADITVYAQWGEYRVILHNNDDSATQTVIVDRGVLFDVQGTGYGTDDNTVWCTSPDGKGEVIINRDGMELYPVQMTKITNQQELQAMDTKLDGIYILMNDIDLTGPWTPVGDYTNRFIGVFHGGGHKIRNLVLPEAVCNGLFGRADGAYIRDITVDVNTTLTGVSSSMYIGALAGYAGTGTEIWNVHTSGLLDINGSSPIYGGGIIGYNNFGYINSSSSSVTVIASSTSFAGGIVGTNTGSITLSYATGAISSSHYAGGITGYNVGASQISYATGDVTAVSFTGGIAGESNSNITRSAALMGRIRGSNTGRIAGSGGSFLNNAANSKMVVNGKFVTGSANDLNGVDTPLSEFKSPKAWLDMNSGAIAGDPVWDFTNDWRFIDGYDYPVLKWQDGPPKVSVTLDDGIGNTKRVMVPVNTVLMGEQGEGYGTDENTVWCTDPDGNGEIIITPAGNIINQSLYPVQMTKITNQQELQAMDTKLDGIYILMNDIDLTGPWTPVGDYTDRFTGVFHGARYEIRNLILPEAEQSGLFGYTINAYIRDLTVNVNTTLTGVNSLTYIGAVAGYADSTQIWNVHTSGQLDLVGPAQIIAGGIVGANHIGSISHSSSSVNVSAEPSIINRAGGIAGMSYGNITLSYATGNVDSSYEAGGIVAFNGGGSITLSYATENITYGNVVGGIAGSTLNSILTRNAALMGSISGVLHRGRVAAYSDMSNTFTNNFANEDMLVNGFPMGDSDTNGTGRPLSEFKSPKAWLDMNSGAIAGDPVWDFTNDWRFIDGYDYPVLKWQTEAR